MYSKLAVFLIIVLVLTSQVVYTGYEIDAICKVVRIVDGDTIVVVFAKVSSKLYNRIEVNREYKIRFADINAPELNTVEGEISKKALEKILKPGDTVFLDIDDEYVFDKYGRIVAVVYKKYNTTYLLNINEWLLENHYADIMDYPNQFNPHTWKLYVGIENGLNTATLTGGSNTHNRERSEKLDTPISIAIILGIAIVAILYFVWGKIYTR